MQAIADAAYLRAQADKCLRLANSISDPEAVAALCKLAAEYRAKAKRLADAGSETVMPHSLMEPPP